jgi:transposase InsO family protein
MAFKERSAMSQKLEFVTLAMREGANVSVLCERHGIGRTCGYKLLGRYQEHGIAGLEERSRRPLHSPAQCTAKTEAAVVALRQKHPAWGGRKIAKVLERSGGAAPAPSTVTGILRRNGMELGRHGGGAKAFIRFEHEAPNDLWQMDFKGHVAMREGRLHPLTVLDDHSRFSITLGACADERTGTVKNHLVKAFRRYGLPTRMAVDNGAPWGDCGHNPYTLLTVWLIEAGVAVSHSKPYHPQTLGKDERFHRSLKAEALSGPAFANLAEAQAGLDRWRDIYNHERPHEALAMATPIERYRASQCCYSETVTPFDYAPGDIVRRVQQKGEAAVLGRTVKLPKAFHGKQVAFRPTQTDGVYDAYFRHQKIQTIDLNAIPR